MENLEKQQEDEIKLVAGDYLSQCKDMDIKTPEQYKLCDDLRQIGKAHIKKVEEFMDPLCKSAHDHHKSLVKSKKDLLAPVEEGRKLVGTKMEAWDAEVERKAEEERERLRKIEEEKEKERERERLLDEAAEAEEEGDTEAAEDLLKEAENPVIEPVNVKVEAPRPKTNTHYRTYYYVEEKTIDKSKLPLEYLSPDISAINKVAMATKGQCKIPGATILKRRTTV